MEKKTIYLCLLLLAFSLCFGIAAQNISFGLFGLLLLFCLKKISTQKKQTLKTLLFAHDFLRQYFFVTSVFILSQILSTLYNENRSDLWSLGTFGSFALGYCFWSFGTLLIVAGFSVLDDGKKKNLFSFIKVLCIFLGVVCLSQQLWNWRIVGSSFVHYLDRPRGFTSHPLTFAYSGLILWPWVCYQVVKNKKSLLTWASFFAVALILILTASRTVQFLSLATLVFGGTRVFSGKSKKLFLASVALACGLIVFVPSPIGQKIQKTFKGEAVDRHSDYADDRLAFWHAHWLMIKERPGFGHGIDLDQKFRLPYYQKLHLDNFIKKYEAHNQYLQVAAESGVIGLGIFLSFVFLVWRLPKIAVFSPLQLTFFKQAFFVFLGGGLTQNAFQDGEVRNILSMGIALIIGTTLTRSQDEASINSAENPL